MAYVITYVKVCLLLYYPVINTALRSMPIRNMYHDDDLVGMVVLTLNLILWLKGVLSGISYLLQIEAIPTV